MQLQTIQSRPTEIINYNTLEHLIFLTKFQLTPDALGFPPPPIIIRKLSFLKHPKKCHWTSSVMSPCVNCVVPHFAFFWMGAKCPKFLDYITMNMRFFEDVQKNKESCMSMEVAIWRDL